MRSPKKRRKQNYSKKKKPIEDVHPESVIEQLNNRRLLTEVDPYVKKKRLQELQTLFSEKTFLPRACAICGEKYLHEDHHTIKMNDNNHMWSACNARLRKMQTEIKRLPSCCVDYYRVQGAEDLWLHPMGAHDNVLNACHKCYQSLARKQSTPPKSSIANGFWVARLPFNISEITTGRLLALGHVVRGVEIVTKGRPHAELHRHNMCVCTEDCAFSNYIPNLPKEKLHRIVFVGPYTPAERAVQLKRYTLDVDEIQVKLEHVSCKGHVFCLESYLNNSFLSILP